MLLILKVIVIVLLFSYDKFVLYSVVYTLCCSTVQLSCVPCPSATCALSSEAER